MYYKECKYYGLLNYLIAILLKTANLLIGINNNNNNKNNFFGKVGQILGKVASLKQKELNMFSDLLVFCYISKIEKLWKFLQFN